MEAHSNPRLKLLAEDGARQFADIIDIDNLNTLRSLYILTQEARNYNPAETQAGSLGDALLGACGWAHLARKANLTGTADALRDGAIVV